MRFGISTHLYHDVQLEREHLAAMAEQGFDAIELFATRSHFDYHDADAIRQLATWLNETGLKLHGIHAPITESLKNGVWGTGYSIAFGDPARREQAVRETAAALAVAQQIEAEFLVIHLGTPDGPYLQQGDNNRDAARRSLEEIGKLTANVGLRLALEVIPNKLSSAPALVNILENDLELQRGGICMDVGHAFILGDVQEAIEVASGHLITTHLHDNDGKSDEHRVPYDGAIDWPSTLMSLRKIGYEGMMLMELGNTSSPQDVLQKARRARERFSRL